MADNDNYIKDLIAAVSRLEERTVNLTKSFDKFEHNLSTNLADLERRVDDIDGRWKYLVGIAVASSIIFGGIWNYAGDYVKESTLPKPRTEIHQSAPQAQISRTIALRNK